MKSSIAPLILCSALTAVPAWAQSKVSGTPSGTTSPGTATPAAPVSGGTGSTSIPPAGKNVVAANSDRPGSTPAEKPKAAPDVKPPDEPIEAYLLSKENGPFMVMAMVFRGPEAEKMALALCKELRHDPGLPAYILRSKDAFPMRGNAVANPPGAVRHHEEVAVLVGDEKTKEATEILLKKVKSLQPKCLNDMPRTWTYQHGIGLSRALRTTNPYLSPGRLQAKR
jgi:hypothetical protein